MTPYPESAPTYLQLGWSPLPLPGKSKSPVPRGFTGALGLYVTQVQLDKWLAKGAQVTVGKMTFRPGNVALRLPRNVIGVDVDAYGEKAGERTLERALKAWGALPPTYVSTSREDGVSGIRLFRVPEGLAWPGELPQGKGVELLRWDHRYAVVYPSIHDKTGEMYRWWKQDDDGNLVETDEVPEVADLPMLPRRWIKGLTNGVKWKDRPVDESMDARDLQDWLAGRNDPDTPCTAMRKTITDYARALRQASDDGGAHDAARNSAWAVIGDSFAGHPGVVKALAELRNIFLTSVRSRRSDEGAARSEWARIVLRGAQKVSAEGDPEDVDPCNSVGALKKRSGRRGLDWEPLDEIGNASRLLRVAAGRARWVEAWGTWAIWSDYDRIWHRDEDRQIERWAVKGIQAMEEEVKHLTDEAAVKAYKSHMKSSLNIGKVEAMIKTARARQGIITPADVFDANPYLLAVGNGVVELGNDGARLRPATQNDYLTVRTPVKYKPGKEHPLWTGFLERVMPNQFAREWLQMLVGYSLIGENTQRILVVIVGPTSTGKTTFANAIMKVLGELAGPIPASVLRDNPDDKPRPDLLAALPRRVVVAEELSAAQHLHPDQIKRLTGGNPITARGMRSNAYLVRLPAFTPWIVANSAPTINGADAAIHRRILAVPFTNKIKQERVKYGRQLIEKASEAILAWMIEGYDKYAADPSALLRVPKAALRAQAELREDMSDLDAFIAEACEVGRDLYSTPTALHEAYEQWCEVNNIQARDRLSGVKLGRDLGAKGFTKKQLRINNVPTWVRVGIALRENT